MTPLLPYAAHLRVYEPLVAFTAGERERWAAYAAAGSAPQRAAGLAAEHRAAVLGLLATPPKVAPDGPEHAFVRRHAGRIQVCPWRTRERSWLALVEFHSGLPEEVAAAFVPTAVADDAESRLERWIADHPDQHLHIRTSAWHVPLAWYGLFERAERELVLAQRPHAPEAAPASDVQGPDAPAATAPAVTERRCCTYLTTMAEARRRSARALAVLRRALADGSLAGQVEEVARWLEEFHPHAIVELDYGGLVQVLTDDELRDDDSPEQVAEALRALGDGDADGAAAACDRVVERWRRVRAIEEAN
ncbi:MAG: hypothetical protein ACJ74O_11455 [Frankiaceae bacterium]